MTSSAIRLQFREHEQMDQSAQGGAHLKTALALWGLGLCGAVLILPYIAALTPRVFEAAASRTHLAVWKILTLSVVQSAVLLAVAVSSGLWAARKLGLGAPLLTAYFSGSPAPDAARRTLLLAVAVGAITGLVLLAMDGFVFAAFPSIAAFLSTAQSAAGHPKAWQGFLASYYGAFDEEILMRLGLLSLLALAFRALSRPVGVNRDARLPAAIFWAANIATALVFGLGHLPATAAIAPLTAAIIVRAIVLNGTAGLVFGVLYRRYGLEWAMASHFAADLVLHVLVG
jgi:hypothetical protein